MRISVFGKMLSLVLCGAIGLVALAAIALFELHGQLVQARVDQMRMMAEAGRSLIASYHAKVVAGEMDEATAKQMALRNLDLIRYSGNNYIFAYTYSGNTLVSPGNPDRLGKNVLDKKDPNGIPFIANMIENAKKGGAPIWYSFTKPNDDKLQPKMSYSVGFEPWQWMIGAGVYVGDIDAEYRSLIMRFVVTGAVVLLLTLSISFVVARNIGRPLQVLASVTKRLAQREYEVHVPSQGRADEVGMLASAIETLRVEAVEAESLRADQEEHERLALEERRQAMLAIAARFEGSVKGVVDTMAASIDTLRGTSETMSAVTHETTDASTSVAGAAEQVAANLQMVAASTEEMSSSVSEIARQISQSSATSQQAVAHSGEAMDMVNGLADAVARIGEVTKLISDIAGQTNLLALNATIEAARAGEAGKGFAVVAGEVKSLANQTAKATDEIASQIRAIELATSKSVEAMRSVSQVIADVNGISTVIAAAIEEQHASTAEIAANCQQAASGARDVSQHVARMAGMTQEVGNAAGAVANISADLEREAGTLHGEVESFLASIKA